MHSLLVTLTHSHPFFKKNNPLPPIFWQKRLVPTVFTIKQPTPTHFSKKSDPLPPIFWQKGHTPTHFLTITTHPHFIVQEKKSYYHFSTKMSPSQPFLMENNPLLPSFKKNNPTAPIFQQICSLPLIFQQKWPPPTILILFSTNLLPKELVFISFPTITDFPSPFH